MLESTFIHCAGVGPTTERRLWSLGARTWQEFLDRQAVLRIGPTQRARIGETAQESLARLAAADYAWFANALPQREHWRALPAFRERVVYLDIETTGGLGADDLTVVGLYDSNATRQFVRGFDLEEFPAAIAGAAVIVTFFGTGFDLPFLRRAYQMEFPQLHIDLCFLLKRLGYSGGLKHVEAAFGLERPAETRGLGGWDAVLLWQRWRRGDRRALDRLLAYNRDDVVNLATLMEAAYPLMLARTWEEP